MRLAKKIVAKMLLVSLHGLWVVMIGKFWTFGMTVSDWLSVRLSKLATYCANRLFATTKKLAKINSHSVWNHL